MRKIYTEDFKKALIQKVLMPGGPSRRDLAEQHNFHPAMISKWIKTYGIDASMKIKKKKSPHNWSPEEKLKALKDTESLNEEDLGAYLRTNGLHSQHLKDWNTEVLAALKAKFYPTKKDPKVLALEKEVKALEKSLNRKDKALAEAAALLILKKKADKYFSDED